MGLGVGLGLGLGLGLWSVGAGALAVEVHLGVRTWWSLVAVALLVTVGVGRRRRVGRGPLVVVVVVVVVVLASAVVTWRVVPLVSGPLVTMTDGATSIDATVVLSSDPVSRSGRTSGSRRSDDEWQVDAATVSWLGAGGAEVAADLPVRLLTSVDVHALLPGTVLRVTARVLAADPMHGRAATLVARTVTVTGSPPPVQGAAGALRTALRDSVSTRPPDQAGLLPGLVVGDTSRVPADLDTAMRASSLAHLTAVSGGNVSVVVLLALGAARLARLRRGRAQVVVVAVAVAAYVVVSRPQPSVVRAAAMTAVVLVAVLLDLRIRSLDALGFSVGALVLLDPFLVLSVGFAMSAAATAALLLLAARRRGPPYSGPLRVKAARAVLAVVVVSSAAQVAVAPLIVGLGGGIPVGGVVANLLAEPAVVPATSCGLLAALVGLVAPPLATLLVLPASWAVGWIALVARTTAQLAPPLPWPGGWTGGLLMVVVLLLGVAATVLLRGAGRRAARACVAVAVVGGVLTLAPPASVPGAPAWPPAGWRIVMCDVGQGDAEVLEVAPGEAVVIDTGPDPDAVDRCLRRLGVAHVPILVLTHFHADHVEGVPGVLRGRDVGVVLVSPLPEPVGEEHRVRGWLSRSGVPQRVAVAGDQWSVGHVRMKVLWPTRIIRGQGSDPNNASVVVQADVEGVSVLLAGDLETAAQEAVLASGVIRPVDVVKVPHHGSAKQAPGWATTTRPRVALIGVGLDNDYGHPYAGTVAAYRALGALVGRTDLDGDLAVLADGSGELGVVRRGR